MGRGRGGNEGMNRRGKGYWNRDCTGEGRSFSSEKVSNENHKVEVSRGIQEW